MTNDIRQRWSALCREAQHDICAMLEALDGGAFEKKPWTKPAGEMLQGGGEMRVLRGDVIEKGGVNFSEVYGTFPEAFRKEIPGAVESGGDFWACGVSLVIHPKNPHMPITHLNIRRIETSFSWFGGGADLTPAIEYAEDTELFHQHMKNACDGYNAQAYPHFKKWADEYYTIKHYGHPRGVGGIFIDSLRPGSQNQATFATEEDSRGKQTSGGVLLADEQSPEAEMALMRAIAEEFIEAYRAIGERRKDTSYNDADKQTQLKKRAQYVEFNLLYDRGTRFGFQTGGNHEAILMSMPPMASWA